MIPNTTPTPNELFNGEMKKMGDAELRVVMIVTRATFGWVLDEETGMRKEEDWISHSQMVEKSGKSSRAISYAITNCIKNHWIQTRDSKGNVLETPDQRKRHGRKIFYRLGPVFLTKVRTIANSAMVPSQPLQVTIANNDIQPSQPLRTTKEIITKEIYTKDGSSNLKVAINPLLDEFKTINPSYERLFGNKTERESMVRLVEKFGSDKVSAAIKSLPQFLGRPGCPQITTPYQLEKKLGQYIAFIKQVKSSNKFYFADELQV